MKALLDKIGSNFFVASFIPASGFLIIVSVLFGPVMSSRLLRLLQSGEVEPMNLSFLSLLALAVIFGFTLSSLSPFTFRVFQGYYFLDHVTWLKNRQFKKAENLWQKAKQCGKDADELFLQWQEVIGNEDTQKQMDDIEQKIVFLRTNQRQLTTDCARMFPPISPSSIMPTELGNIIRAAEAYPATQYGIDKVTMWPRLLEVISEGYYSKLEQSENILFFAINSALLTLIIAWISFLVGFDQFVKYLSSRNGVISLTSILGPNSQPENNYGQMAFQYLIALLVALLLFYALYRIAILNSEMYAGLMRGAFDLFRHDLLVQLKMPLPPDEVSEFILWTTLSGFFARAQYEVERASPLQYTYRSSSDSGGISQSNTIKKD